MVPGMREAVGVAYSAERIAVFGPNWGVTMSIAQPTAGATGTVTSARSLVDRLPVRLRSPLVSDRQLESVVRHGVMPVARRLYPLDIDGGENVPATGPVIVAANHISFFDTVALMLGVPRPTSFVGKAEYMDKWATRRLFPALGLIPIEREQARQAMAALDVAASVLRGNGVLAIYPEGTRSRDGLLHKGHTGVAQLALMTGAPVVPVGIIGTDAVQPIGSNVPRPFRRCTLRFGEPLLPGDYGGPGRRRRHQLTGDLMEAIRRLSGRQVSEAWASEEPPLFRGGSESVSRVVPTAGDAQSGWRGAAQVAVGEVCGSWDDARVGEVRRLSLRTEADGSVHFMTEMSVTVKFRPPATADGSVEGEQ